MNRQTIRTVRDARLEKLNADADAAERDAKVARNAEVQRLKFEARRARSLAAQSEDLGLAETAADYLAEAVALEAKAEAVYNGEAR